jgi:transposase
MMRICIDDFALKKRLSYGTIMIDFDTHRIVDMIPSREYEAVKTWLKTYPNVVLVSRDGSITYHSAIADALPNAFQVSDRFHLLKNLTSYAQEYLKKALKSRVRILIDSHEISDTSSLERFGATLKSDHSYLSEEKLQQKVERIDEVRTLKEHGFSLREIARRSGLHFKTVQKYLDSAFDPANIVRRRPIYSILTPFMPEIDTMLSQGMSGTVIMAEIRKKGYTGSYPTVRRYVAKWKDSKKQRYHKSQNIPINSMVIERSAIFKLLYHPIEKVKAITLDQFHAIIMQYSCFAEIYALVWWFKSLLSAKDPNELDLWIDKAKSLNIREINSFTEGIARDLAAVKNAIAFPYSNGLAEGSVNKLKVIKRIMYGRCRFETLRTKVLRLEAFRQ